MVVSELVVSKLFNQNFNLLKGLFSNIIKNLLDFNGYNTSPIMINKSK